MRNKSEISKMTGCLKLKILTTVAILLKYFYTSELVLTKSAIINLKSQNTKK